MITLSPLALYDVAGFYEMPSFASVPFALSNAFFFCALPVAVYFISHVKIVLVYASAGSRRQISGA